MRATTPSEAALMDEIRQLRARVASLELERQIPKEIIEKAPVMISIVRAPDFVYELVNPAFQALAPGKEFLGRRFADVWSEVPGPLVENLQNVIATGQTFHLEDAPYTIQRGPGMPPEVVYVSYSWIPLFGPEGKPDRVLTLAHEVTGAVRQRQQLTDSITELRRAEKENQNLLATVHAERDKLSAVITNINDEVWFADAQKRLVLMNPAVAREFHLNASEHPDVGKIAAHLQVLRPDGSPRPVEEAPLLRALNGEVITCQEEIIRTPGTGQMRNREVSSAPVKDASGNTIGSVAVVRDITERKRAEQALRESEERFRVLTENLQSAVALLDETGAFTIVNSSFLCIFDIPPDADILNINNRDWSQWQVFSEDGLLLDVDEHPVRRAARSCTAVKNQLVGVKSPSSPDLKWLLVSAEPILDSQGKLYRLICTYYDITGRKRAEEALQQSLERLEKVLDVQTVGVMFWDLSTGCMVNANDTFLKLMGYSRSEVEARELTWQKLTPPEYMDVSRAEIEKFMATGRVGPYEKEYFRKDGTRRWLLFAGSSLGNNQCVEFCVDISDRKRAEQALRESEAQFRDLADAMPQLVWTATDDGLVDYYNARERFYARTDKTDGGVWKWQPLIHPRDLDRTIAAWGAAVAGSDNYQQEHRVLMADGSYRWHLSRAHRVRSAGGGSRWYGTATDIDDLKRADEALADAAQRLDAHMDNSPLAIIEFDPDFRVIRWSKEAERVFGWTAEEILGRAISEMPWVHEDDVQTVRRISKEMLEGKQPRNSSVNRNYRKDRSIVECEWYNSAIYDASGSLASILSQVLDITERKRTEERLRQSQKLESVGLLAGGIAHDFNNLLTGVMGYASLLLEDAAPERAEILRSIVASSERAAHLTRQLLAYSGKGQFIVRELDVTQAVSEMADLVQFSIPKSVSLALNLERRLPPVAMDPGQLQQILMNLVINAGEAIGDGNPGRITVTTSMADVESPFMDELGEELAPGRYVCIEVQDTGSGIDPEKKVKIFDPFFTTKFVGRGLGLAAIAGILRSQKGGMIVESKLGKGSTFRAFLPAAGRNGLAVQDLAARAGHPTVLVVEDEVTVREFISAVLHRKGYHAIEASDGQEALALCGSAPGAIGAAIVDIIMPNMSANDLLVELKAKQPGIRILLTSGYSEAEARRLCTAYPGAAFIQKPYTAQQLAKAVEELVVASGYKQPAERFKPAS